MSARHSMPNKASPSGQSAQSLRVIVTRHVRPDTEWRRPRGAAASVPLSQRPTRSPPRRTYTGENFSYGGIDYSTFTPENAPGLIGSIPSVYAPMVTHAMVCAFAYGGLPQTMGIDWAQPAPGWSTYFDDQYSWSDYTGYLLESSNSNSPPPGSLPDGGSWYAVYGITTPSAFTDTSYGQTDIFLNALASSALLVSTLAHEFGHQWGLSDNPATPGDPMEDANAYGNLVAAAYVADKGQKCGGLQ